MRINSFLIKLKLNKYGEINLFKIFLCLDFMKTKNFYWLEKIIKILGNNDPIIRPEIMRQVAYNTKKGAPFFVNKNKIPSGIRSNLFYQYSCGISFNRVYLGETSRQIRTRVKQNERQNSVSEMPLPL